MKCKIIEGKIAKSIEKDVNEWLSTNSNIQIKFITQGATGRTFLTSIFYE